MATTGTAGDDFFRGSRFSKEIYGLGGADGFRGSRGEDRLDGGSGVDTIEYAFSFTGLLSIVQEGEAVNVDLQRATQQGDLAEGDVLIAIENVGGSRENDVIRGDGVANILSGNGGSDILEGRGGDDTLFGDQGATVNLGIAGDDLLDGGTGNDDLFGEGGNDTLIGGSGVNSLDGGTGTDTASYAGQATGMLVALTGTASNGVALVIGGNTGDSLTSIENIIGSNFADNLSGLAITNVLDGGGGNDLVSGGGGADTLIGGLGVDTASYTTSSAGVDVDLGVLSGVSTPSGTVFIQSVAGTGVGGDAQGDTLNGFENMTGSNFNDTLTGNVAANRLEGRAGDDIISGGGGNDTIIGGAEVDIERLSGGAGFDTFVYLARSDSNTGVGRTGDFILDFNVDQDLIDLRTLGVNVANLQIINNTVDGVHFARVTEDLNGNGQADETELSINLIVESAADLTLQDILI